MIVVDTSVWVDHLRAGDAALAASLDRGEVLVHAFVVGELACGPLADRAQLLGLLQALPQAALADPAEILGFIDRHRLAGRGIGYVDVHLLASALLDRARLWTRDRRLAAIAAELGLAPAAPG